MLIYALYKASFWNHLDCKNKRIRVVAVAVTAYVVVYQVINHLIKDKKIANQLIKYLCYIVGADLVSALLFNYMGEDQQSAEIKTMTTKDEPKDQQQPQHPHQPYIPSHLQHLQNTPHPTYMYSRPPSVMSHISTYPHSDEQPSTLGTAPPVNLAEAKPEKKPKPKPKPRPRPY